MKTLLLLISFFFLLNAEEVLLNADANTSKEPQKDTTAISSEEPIVVEDNSGLSDDEVRSRAKVSDKEKKKKVTITDVVEAVDHSGNVDMTQLQKKWEEQSPSPLKYDWVQTKSGEWFKGDIKAMYDGDLEFDSDEIGLYTFDFDDISQIKSYNIISVNIENLATFPGIIRMKDEKINVIQGDNDYEFDVKDIVSFAPDGEREIHYWSIKVTVSLDVRSGNVVQYDYSAQANLKRRTSTSRLYIDYLGRVSSKDNEEIARDHRLNAKYDRYVTRYFFWTPISAELYTNKFINIESQYTAGMGLGYTIIDTKKLEWSLSSGPAIIKTNYVSVEAGRDLKQLSPALEVSTKVEYEINTITDLKYDYRLTWTDNASGRYKHNMILKLENELLSWLDFDVTGIWDYVQNPEVSLSGITPLQSDYQLLIGLGVEF